MAAVFPNAKKTFSQIVNGVTKLVASIFNVSYDEVEAVETFIGPTGGGAQAYSESLTNLLYNYRKGCACEYKGAADLYVRSGEIMITDASGNRRLRRNTSDTTVAWSFLDVGSEASSMVYYIYATADTSATTYAVKLSTNATAPTGPTFYKQIGYFYNNLAGNIDDVGNLPKKSGLGQWVTKTNGTSWLAPADGFVCAWNSSNGTIKGFTDSANPPTVERQRQYSEGGWAINLMMPVRQGDYYLVTGATTVYWISFS